MKKAVMFIMSLAPILLAGCGSSTDATRNVPGSDDLKRYEADFHPSDHDADPDSRTTSPASPNHPGEEHRAGDTSTPPESELTTGFRVQIYSTTSIDAAKAKKAEAESFFPGESVYMQYDPPTYKIRVGNFTLKYEADRFVRLAIERGFAESWAVPEKVLKKPAQQR